jgi:hypothetical protein
MSADAKLDAFEHLLDELSGRLADFLTRAEHRDQQHDGASEAAATALADLVKVLKARGNTQELAGLVRAVQAMKVEPHFHVPPAQVVVQPAPAEDVTWEVRVQGQNGAPDRHMTITKTTNRRT